MKNTIKKYRKICHLTQLSVAKAVGVSRNTISSLERGKYNPSLILAHKLSVYMFLPIETIFIFENEDNINENAN